VVLLNSRYVKSLVVGNKNDFNDAQAIFDAVSRPNKRVVDQRFNRLCQDNELSRRFLAVPGIGSITATIIASGMGTGKKP